MDDPVNKLTWATSIVAMVLVQLAGPADAESTWRKLGAVGNQERRFRNALDDAEHLAIRAAEQYNQGDEGRARALALRAADAYEKAAELSPRHPEPHYRAAEILNGFFVDGQDYSPPPHPTMRAIRHWNRFLELAPADPRAEDVLFTRSLAYTKLGGDKNFEKAAADYESILSIIDTASAEPAQVATIMTNAAEVYMGIGKLDRAIELYTAGLEHNREQVYAYGLAVALDRNGQHVRAREVMANYRFRIDVMRPQPPQLVTFFFVPRGDEFWYYALGQESNGDLASARNYYKQYLRFQGNSRYADLARRHIQRLDDLIKRGAGKRKQPPAANEQPKSPW